MKYINQFMKISKGFLVPSSTIGLNSKTYHYKFPLLSFVREFSNGSYLRESAQNPANLGSQKGSDIFSMLANQKDDSNRQQKEERVKERPRSRISFKKQETMDPSYTLQSMVLRSSLKKVGALCRQIAHKPFYHALLQMKMSDKKISKYIATALVSARENAVREAGLDESTLYVDQIWVGKAKYLKKLITMGRGGRAIERSPRVRVTVVLRDERALLRDLQRRQQRLERKKVWTPLPNRPIYLKSNFFTC
ncbi:mitochondrial ribosomal protein subunit L22 [Schizosaccharomyces pombe]|uniref:Large ribosomal subunit protein uL22m n=1 Tax=Schizosaccharomyces pombe (strain 972 / ATCC 24843) TaxID=284812 RepID=RM22_SCHPO|nr:putative mitochondrial ribosomal protein subunit L22 [Schizosaccharomyces pombe]O74464.1 RecName: Full=Large ribosomal subunit protein uL22m; AltName: Full=54S ribosomal protein L22, mitochondrial; Flags: Precursor [Schizosaccharomyces pombe 972h-]CAA20776.1 mitochondrial ribosomal protein subunit L22 (predicted) [Schizosaccharomyces pombe]|eukprot:NP_588410.1 putative mitochondrial ribosomal protein subunit L22 [Schizosaccharomyces pombe]